MTNPADVSKDPVIQAVIELNSTYQNTEYAKRHPTKAGSGKIYTVAFKGGDGIWRENYVFERGEERRPYYSLGDLFKDGSNGLFSPWTDPDFLRIVVVCFISVVLAIAMTYVVIWESDNKQLQALTGAFGLTLGYLVGRSDKAK